MPHDGTPHVRGTRGTRDIAPAHPAWCDREECTVPSDSVWGWHHSTTQTVTAEPAIDTVIQMYWSSSFPAAVPRPLLSLDIYTTGDDSEEADLDQYVLTPDQARQLYDGLAHLLLDMTPN